MTNSPVIAADKREKMQASMSASKSSATPEDVAKGITTGILRNKTRIMVGTGTKILDKRHLPGAYSKLMHKQLEKMYEQTLG